jgi:hypothetical protein
MRAISLDSRTTQPFFCKEPAVGRPVNGAGVK